MKRIFICIFVVCFCFSSAEANSNDDIAETKVFCAWWESDKAWQQSACLEYIMGAFDSANALGVIREAPVTKGSIVESVYEYAKNNKQVMKQPTVYTLFEALFKRGMLKNENFKNAMVKSLDNN